MKREKKILLAAACLALAAGTAEAAPVYQLRGITVTATRQAESLQDVPANVQVVTEKQIRERNVQTAAEAVSMATGVYVDHTTEPSVSIRGYDSKNVLVLLDGQPMNSGWNGNVDWGMIPVDNIRRVEVVSGGQSALYGGRAVGGVINIMTKTQKEDGVHGTVHIGYGSNNTWKQSYSVSGKADRLTYGAFYESRITDGWRTYKVVASSSASSSNTNYDASGLPHDTEGRPVVGDRGKQSFMSESYGFNLGYDFNEDKKLSYRYSHSNYHWEYKDPHSYVKDAAGNSVWTGNVGSKSFKDSNFLGTRGWREYDMHSLTYNDQKNKVHAHFGMTDYTKDGYTSAASSVKESKNFEGSGSKYSYPSKTWNFDLNKRWTLGAHTILFGGSYGEEKFDETISKTITNWKSWKSAVKANKGDQRLGGQSKMWSLYLQDKWDVSDRWTAYIGGRYDHYTKHDGYSSYADGRHSEFGSTSYDQFSPKLSLDYKLNEGTNFYISYGKSFNPPLLYQVYRVADRVSYGNDKRPTYANPDLKPETTTNWELGMKKKLGGHTSLSAAVFYAETDDYIKLVKNGPNDENGRKQYQNVGEAKTHGAEISINYTISPKWSSYLNYTWQVGRVSKDTGGTKRNYDLPRHLLHTGVTYTNAPWTVILDGMFTSSRNDPTDGELYTGCFGSYDPYFILNLDANYQLNKDTAVQFSVYNLFDRDFYDDEVTAGRTYNISVRYSF